MIEDEQAFARFKEQILRDGPRLGLNDKFRFACHPEVPCFNQCCRDVNIFLTPYDILRLKTRLGVTSGEFLDRYCIIPFSKAMRYPVVMLKMREDEERTCPFVEEATGCAVYEDRPWSCRMYPIGRADPPKGHQTERSAFHFMLHEEFCRGHEEAREWTVAQWLDDQGVGDYDRQGAFFQALAQDERLGGDTELTPEQMDMLFMVCYDIDRFRRFVFETKFLKMFEIADDRIGKVKSDDLELMRLGFDWIRFALWKEKTLKIRDEIVKARLARTGIQK